MTSTRVHLLRHGQVEGHEVKRYNGQGDTPLTYVLDPEREAGAIGLDLDRVGVAVDRGVGPDLERGAVGADAGETEGGGDIDVGGKALGPFPGGALENAAGLREALEVDGVLDEVGGAGEAARGLAGDHADAVDPALGRGSHGVEAEQRAGGDEDTRSGLGCSELEVGVDEELAHGQGDEDAALFDGGQGQLAEDGGGGAFDDDVGRGYEVGERQEG
ncbi:MAG: hypothetical protein R6W66_09550, partial [Pelovirga sp.]